jgi:hypothetical protein
LPADSGVMMYSGIGARLSLPPLVKNQSWKNVASGCD